MNAFINSSLLRDLAKAMQADITVVDERERFACRPLTGYTSERNIALARFRGPIGFPNIKEFQASLEDIVSDNLIKVILDFAAASLTRTAVGALARFAASIHGRNKRLYLYRPSAQVRGVLKELGLSLFFTFLETEDDVLATIVV